MIANRFPNHDDKDDDQVSSVALTDIVCLILGIVLLSIAFGWAIGGGIGCLVYFHKHPY